MPFHSTLTEGDAIQLIMKHCTVKPFRVGEAIKFEMVAERDWSGFGVAEAIESACRQFGLKPKGE